MSNFVKVARVAEIPAGEARTFAINGKQIALYNVNGNFYATVNVCLHMGGPLDEGMLTHDVIMCPWHGWEYDVKTGECLTTPGAVLQSFPTKINGDEIYIDLG